MTDKRGIKDLVRKKYGEIAAADPTAGLSCCGSAASCCDSPAGVDFSESYEGQEGYLAEADMGLGCGLPTAFSTMAEGQTVLDLGSGAGNDAFLARAQVGEKGHVIGLDFTPEMIAKARKNAELRGFSNVEFLQGDIENIPLPDCSVDVIISNCVLNLVPDKNRVSAEIFRVLRPGKHFSITVHGIRPEED
jgi:arsenite methyltransferase